MIYKEVVGDLFKSPTSFILVHCISSDFALGAGIAKTFNYKYGVRDHLINTYKRNKWEYRGYCLLSDSYENNTKKWTVANLVTKNKYYEKPTYKTLADSLKELKGICVEKDYHHIAMPVIGCGLDGLTWDKVSAIIKDIFHAFDCEIVVYHFNDK